MADRQLRLPTLDLRVEGARLPDALAQSFTSLRVHQHLSRPSVCELVFTGSIGTEDPDLFAPGKALDIQVRGSDTALFEGHISSTEHGLGSDRATTLAVRAFDSLVSLRNRQTARAFVNLSAADLARELVADLGLSVQCDEPGPAWPRVLQTGTDFELLLDIAERSGLHFTLQDGSLWLHTLQGRGTPVPLVLRDNLHEARIETNAHGSCHRVSTLGWNPWRGIEHTAEAGEPRRPRSGMPPDAAGIGGADPLSLLGRALQSDEHAQALAQAELDARGARAVVFWGTAAGDARLRPGARVQIKGLPSHLSGDHVLVSARHTLDAEHGFVSELSSELPPSQPRASGTLMTLGEVTRIDDPDRLGRVQVAMPAYGNVESDWLQVASAGAGKAKGLVIQPDIGDRVLLLLDHADPAQAVVLGSLYGEVGLPEEQGGLGKDASFCFVTPGGHRVRLDDGSRTVRITGSAGSQLEMAPDHVRLHAAAPLSIEAPGQKLVLRAKFIDFERT